MLTEITKPFSLATDADLQAPSYPVTPYSLMLVMAYLHNYTPNAYLIAA